MLSNAGGTMTSKVFERNNIQFFRRAGRHYRNMKIQPAEFIKKINYYSQKAML